MLSPVFGITSENRAVDYFLKGELLLRQSAYLDAITEFQKSITLNPFYKESFLGMGECYYELGNYDESFRNFKQAYLLDESDIDSLLWLGKCRVQQQDLLGAELFFFMAKQKEPRNKNLNLEYGNLMKELGYYTLAESFYNTAIEIDPTYSTAYIQLASVLEAQNKIFAAEDNYKKAIEINRLGFEPHYSLALFYYNQERFRSSLEEIHKAERINPENTDIQVLDYKVNIQLKEYQEAYQIMLALIEEQPDTAIYHYLAGILLYSMNDYEESFYHLNKALQMDPSDEIMRWAAGEAAIKAYDYKSDIRNQLAQYYLDQGQYLYDTRNLDKAEYYFKRGLQLSPKNINLRLSLSQIYKDYGEYARYFQELKILRRLSPEDQDIIDEYEYFRRLQYRLYYTEASINQFTTPDISPIVALSTFENEQEIDDENVRYNGTQFFRKMLYHALNQKESLNVMWIDIADKNRHADYARDNGASFMIDGTMEFEDNRIVVQLRIVNLHTGLPHQQFYRSKRGNDKYLNMSLTLAKDIEEVIPVFGTIIQKQGENAIINIGKTHQASIEQVFYILPDKENINTLIENPSLLENDEFLQGIAVGTFTVNQMDERIAGGQIQRVSLFDQINEGDYVIQKPQTQEETTQQPDNP